jgi:hypothetical protein
MKLRFLKPPRIPRSWLTAFLLLLIGVLPVAAHFCGPRRIELKVGEACLWRIVADLIETDSRYSPVLEGPGGVEVSPLKNFMARHGDFVIVGKAPGTNKLSVAWSYQPTGAVGLCDVEIVVVTNQTGVTYQSPGNFGFLSARSGAADISAEDLRSLLDRYVPAEAKKLLIFTQCYGGNMATSDALVNAPNIAIASATSPKQTGKYGGYHDDAARALRPADGRTAQDLHQTASQGKMTMTPAEGGMLQDKSVLHNNSEWPRTAGGLTLSSFSLDPVSATGPVKSRHIVIFMGQPEAKQVIAQNHDGSITIPSAQGTLMTIDDVADRDAVKASFSNEPNTTVTTAGGNPSPDNASAGQNGWDFPGDADGLKRAIEQAGQAIRASADPATEQFILFVGDHGSQTSPFLVTPYSLGAGSSGLFNVNLENSGVSASLSYTLQLSVDNQPAINLQYTLAPGGGQNPQLQAPALAGAAAVANIQVELTIPGQPVIRLSQPTVHIFDIDGDGVVEPGLGEHVNLQFPVAETLVLRHLLLQPFEAKVINGTTTNLVLQQFGLSTGRISREAYVIPPPLITAVRPAPAGRLELTLEGAPGYSFELRSSTDLTTWTLVRTVSFSQAIMKVEVTPPSGSGPVFFRLEKKFPRLP